LRKKEKQLSSQYDKYFGRVIIFRKDIIFERENILKSDSIFLLRRDQFLCISVFMFFESVQANFLPGHFWSKVGRQADEYITRGVMFLCFLCFYVCLYERGETSEMRDEGTSLGDIYSRDFVLYVLYVETVPVPQTPLANKLFVNTRCQPWRPAAWPVPLPVA
jgi:hypothetical protein